MDIHWYCYLFDYAEFTRLRPVLCAAVMPATLASIVQEKFSEEPISEQPIHQKATIREPGTVGPEVAAIIDTLLAGVITMAEARAALVKPLCCRGEPLPFDPGLSRVVSRMERIEGMEEGAHLLATLLCGGRNMEPWLKPSSGMVGFLTPQETSALNVAFVSWRVRSGRQRRPSVRLSSMLAVLIRHLLDGNLLPEEIMNLLGQLLDSATRNGYGIAAINAKRA